MKKQLPIYGVLLALAGYAGWIWLKPEQGPQGMGGNRGAVPVTLAAAAPRPMGEVITALGTAQSREGVTITAQQSGLIEAIHFRDGDTVKAGQLLITLHDDEEQAKVRESEARLADQKRQFERLSNLAKENAVARSTLDERKAGVEVAEAQLAVARAALEKRYIHAPFAGVLGARQVSPGALLTPGSVVTTLDDLSRVRVEFSVPETLAAGVGKGMQINARAVALGNREFAGTLTHVDARINAATRTLALRAEIDNPKQELKPGMLIDISLSQQESEALAVPEGTLLSLADQHYVFLVSAEGKAVRTEVKTGRRRVGYVEVLSGLKAGDQVVLEGIHKVRDGQSVAPVGAGQKG